MLMTKTTLSNYFHYQQKIIPMVVSFYYYIFNPFVVVVEFVQKCVMFVQIMRWW